MDTSRGAMRRVSRAPAGGLASVRPSLLGRRVRDIYDRGVKPR